MMDHYQYAEQTPSINFQFDESNMKMGEGTNQYVPYEYSNTTDKHFHCQIIKIGDQYDAVTPLLNKSSKRPSKQKVNTQQFFQDFENNFEVKFGESPLKCEFSKHLDFNFENDESQKENNLKLVSNISEPFQNCKQSNVENIESADNKREKNNNPNQEKTFKLQCQIRRRVLFKRNDSLAQKGNNKQNKGKIINDKNLMVVTSGNWTGVQQKKKGNHGPFSQPIKNQQKKGQGFSGNIFTSHNGFRETLRSTTLDNWKKKHISCKRKQAPQQKSKRSYNLFQKPFSLIR